jgi:hypothetical protein
MDTDSTVLEADHFGFTDSPLRTGLVLGVSLAVLGRFLVPFDLVPLALAFSVVGILLVLYGRQFWPLVGQSLTAVGVSSLLALGLLVLVFG